MKNSIDGTEPSLFHEGEIAMQRSVGMAERMARIGAKVVRDFMPDQHRDFYARLPFILVATVDDTRDVWPTILTGQPGFVSSPTPTLLKINAQPQPLDPAAIGAQSGAAIGILGIELHTRRRNRMNGEIQNAADGYLEVGVGHAFGNCPQYIQLRDIALSSDADHPSVASVEETHELTTQARAIISAADTFFVASYVDREGERQIDVSHRGGKSGFVRIDDDDLLTVPDFSGNSHFNTLGNFVLNPRAGLLFIDFETGAILQLTGTAQVVARLLDIAEFEGAERFWTFRPNRVVLRQGSLPFRWSMRENAFSAKTLKTGSWGQGSSELAKDSCTNTGAPFPARAELELGS